MSRWHIGIDPDKGWAVWDSADKTFLEIRTTTFWGIIDRIPHVEYLEGGCEAWIEDPSGNSPVWHKGPSPAAQSMIAQHVGENKAKAKLLLEYFERKGIVTHAVTPTQGSFTKLSAQQFEQWTGWKERTSEHGRDAASLVFGR